MPRLLRVLGWAAACLCVLVALVIGLMLYDARSRGGTGAEYVALGSSFASGPGIGVRAAGAALLCQQSTDNYAHLLARKRNLRLLDRSCAGSTTADILSDGQFFQTPQIESIGPETRLVTITTGGNDLGYLVKLWTSSCGHAPGAVPWWLKRVCKAQDNRPQAVMLQGLSVSMNEIAKQIRRRAPQAQIAFVEYATILPDHGGCPDRLPLSTVEIRQGRAVAAALAHVTEQAALANGAFLVRASEVTRGHDVCAADPWVTGWAFPTSFLGFGPYPYHPNAKAMNAIARVLDEELK